VTWEMPTLSRVTMPTEMTFSVQTAAQKVEAVVLFCPPPIGRKLLIVLESSSNHWMIWYHRDVLSTKLIAEHPKKWSLTTSRDREIVVSQIYFLPERRLLVDIRRISDRPLTTQTSRPPIGPTELAASARSCVRFEVILGPTVCEKIPNGLVKKKYSEKSVRRGLGFSRY
jgi:hypothetical protein